MGARAWARRRELIHPEPHHHLVAEAGPPKHPIDLPMHSPEWRLVEATEWRLVEATEWRLVEAMAWLLAVELQRLLTAWRLRAPLHRRLAAL